MPRFNPSCKKCPRLVSFMQEVKDKHPTYFCKPVPVFGDSQASLLIVGLAPGMHGADATGRAFTGDASGNMLFRTLHQFGFSSKLESISVDDGLELINCRITNAVKCLPPENKPTTAEIVNCTAYLRTELKALPEQAVVLALGSIAHSAVLRAYGLKQSQFKFAHEALHELPDGKRLLDSYHCSRYNTQTKRLTPAMFEAVFEQARVLLQV